MNKKHLVKIGKNKKEEQHLRDSHKTINLKDISINTNLQLYSCICNENQN